MRAAECVRAAQCMRAAVCARAAACVRAAVCACSCVRVQGARLLRGVCSAPEGESAVGALDLLVGGNGLHLEQLVVLRAALLLAARQPLIARPRHGARQAARRCRLEIQSLDNVGARIPAGPPFTSRLAKKSFLFGHLFFNTTNVFCAKKRVGHACTGPSMVNKNLFLGRPACYLLYLLKLYVGKISFSIFEI